MLLHPASRPAGLTAGERDVLDLERSWWKHASPKETQVRDLLGISAADYHLRLDALLDRSEAAAYDPLVVRRLRRLRAAQRDERASRARHPAGRASLGQPEH